MTEAFLRHRRFWMLLLCCGCWTGSAVSSLAQTSEAPTPLPARTIEIPWFILVDPIDAGDVDHRRQDVVLWVDQFAAWKKWHDEWRNRVEPGWFRARDRRPRPEPPPWLFDQCLTLLQPDSLFEDACRMLVEWNDDAAAEVQATNHRDATAAGGPANEEPLVGARPSGHALGDASTWRSRLRRRRRARDDGDRPASRCSSPRAPC